MRTSDANEHIEKDPIEARQGSRTKVNLVVLIISTVAAAVAMFVLLAPAMRL